MVIVPEVGETLLKILSTAMFAPPAAAYISKFVSTCDPFMLTLNDLCPIEVK
jgi:hypothetical protein